MSSVWFPGLDIISLIIKSIYSDTCIKICGNICLMALKQIRFDDKNLRSV